MSSKTIGGSSYNYLNNIGTNLNNNNNNDKSKVV